MKIKYFFFLYICISFRVASKTVNPIIFLSPNRIDITAKYIYTLFRDKSLNSEWGKNIYLEHLRCWCNLISLIPKNTILNYACAFPYAEKKTTSDWLNSFNTLINSMKKEGFQEKKSVVPYNIKNNVLLDGGHRVATALYFNYNITVKSFTHGGEMISMDMLEKKGMCEKYLDAMALTYASLKKNTFIVTLFPAAKGNLDKVIDILSKNGSIVYKKNLLLTQSGAINFIKMLYDEEVWLGNYKNNFFGANAKMKYCFPTDTSKLITVFLYESDSLFSVKEAKNKIRDIYGISNNSIHINDTHQETLRIAQSVFNKNSIHFINYRTDENFKLFETFFTEYKKLIKETEESDNYCIDTGGVLAAYGIRDCHDLDILHWRKFPNSLAKNKFISSHEAELKYHITTKDDIIFNPENHFYYKGLKFASINIIKKMKENRNEIKDRSDIKLINQKCIF
jgi:hypothetical protein